MNKSSIDVLKHKRRKNRSNKVIIEFDEKKREEYLTGFQKRKNERRKKAKEDELKMLKEKKKQVKEKKKAEYEAHMKSMKLATGSMLYESGSGTTCNETVHITPSHTITVTELDFKNSIMNSFLNDDDDDEDENDSSNNTSNMNGISRNTTLTTVSGGRHKKRGEKVRRSRLKH